MSAPERLAPAAPADEVRPEPVPGAQAVGNLTLTGTPEQRAALFAAMAHVLGEVQRVPKTGVNEHFGYRFATEADVTDVVRPAMAAAGLCVFPTVDQVSVEGLNVRGWMTVTFAHAGGATVTTTWSGFVRMAGEKDDKGLWKLYTGIMKYVILKTFLVPTGDEPEATEGQPERQPQQRRRQRRAPEGEAAEPASNGQVTLLKRLLGSHVFTEKEKAGIQRRLDAGMTKTGASEAIDWAQKALTERKAAEAQGGSAQPSVEERVPGEDDGERPAEAELPLGEGGAA